jgi:predicted nuclease of predicted toxin-antitoxin system
MKLLFDQNLSFKLCQAIADLLPDSNHVGPLGLSAVADREAGNQSTATIGALLRRHAELIAAFGNDGDASCLEIY